MTTLSERVASTVSHVDPGAASLAARPSFVGEREIASLDDAGLTELRRDRIGFVFQSFNLVPTLTARDNITLSVNLAGQA